MAAGLIDETRLSAALSEQRKWGGKLGRTLVEMGFVQEDAMVHALSQQLQLPSVDLDRADLPASLAQLLRVDMAERYGVFPLAHDPKHHTLTVASSDPTNVEALQELTFRTNQRILTVVATSSAIDRAIRRAYYGESTTASRTATPQSLGLSEPNFELEAARTFAGTAAADVGNTAELERRIAAVTQRVESTEKLLTGQLRAMRTLLELLVEKGLISRDEYVARVRGRTDS